MINRVECGEVGEYLISAKASIPKAEKLPSGSAWLSNLVTVEAQIGEDEECEGSVGTLVGSYQMESTTLTRNADGDNKGLPPTSIMLLLLIALVMAGTTMYTMMRRRRDRAEELEGSDKTPGNTRYEKFKTAA